MAEKKSNFKFKNIVNFVILGALLAVMLMLDVTGVLKRSTANMMTEIGFYIILAVSLNLVVGFLGELSLGHAGFMCIGAYLGGFVAKMIIGSTGSYALALAAAMAVGGIAAAIIGFLICIPTLRLKGDYLAIVTLAFGEIIRTLFKNFPSEWFGGAMGFSSVKWTDSRLYIIALITAIVTVFVAQNLKRSRHGRAIQAIRDNEIAAKACGVNVTSYKLLVFVVAAFFAGIAGVIYSFHTTPVEYSFFDFNKSIEILVMVVLGGMGNITGSIVAATLLTFINNKLTTALSGDLAALKYLIYALILIIMVIYNNAPMFAKLRDTLSIKRLVEKIRRKPVDETQKKAPENAEWAKIPTKIPMDAILSTDVKKDKAPDEKGKSGKAGDR